MKCYKCGKGMSESRGMIPVDPAGIHNRRWVCIDCANIVQKQSVPEDVREFCNTICGENRF